MSKDVTDDECDASVRLERAIDYYLVQDVEAAMADIDKAVSLLGDDWAPYFIRAFVRFKQLELNRMNAAQEMQGVAPMQNSYLPDLDYRLVKSDLDRVIELQPSFAEAYFNRADVSAKLNDFKSAIVDYTTAISLNDRFAEAYYNRGLAKIYTGDAEGGAADLSKAGELGMYQAYSIIRRFR
ncbi:MAG: tetratricopeptide repeat protein [Bacteroidaceae bacterium]|nr:tetratricopeptide repeat protein [Bacteroidaceae bacterium]